MAPHPEYPRTRLYVTEPLEAGVLITPDEKRAHYLLQVMRLGEGEKVAVFNGEHGEFSAVLQSVGKKTVTLRVEKLLRAQQKTVDLWLLAAPIKGGKTEWIVEKATELGISRFCPVASQFTIVDRINEERLQAIAIEAAEQCERTSIPVIDSLMPLTQRLGNWPKERTLIYGDESGAGKNAKELLPTLTSQSFAVLIGPEGGFSQTEFEILRTLPFAQALSMGPRVMRADTATVAALSLVQAWCGDWHDKPAFRIGK